MIAVTDIAYVRFTTPDLDVMEGFLKDFGLHRSARTDSALYMRCAGSQHHVHISEKGPFPGREGFGLYANSLSDLEKLASETGGKVEENSEPGGGYVVRLVDPAGVLVDVIYGQEKLDPLPTRSSLPLNFAGPRKRQNATQRFTPGPSTIMRAGHVVIRTPNYNEAYEWYSGLLGMKISDSYYAGEESNIRMAFLHCGLGEAFVDHHTVAILEHPHPGIDHSAFEVLDYDDVLIGSEFLQQAGHKHAWGVGRHIEGSQIFDYWRDPNGTKIEHWTDGDAVNDHYPGKNKPVGNTSPASGWAPPFDPEFYR